MPAAAAARYLSRSLSEGGVLLDGQHRRNRRLAIVLDEGDDATTAGDFDAALLQQVQKVSISP